MLIVGECYPVTLTGGDVLTISNHLQCLKNEIRKFKVTGSIPDEVIGFYN
jgi:hypothetical protein